MVSGNIYYNMKPDYWGGQSPPLLDYWEDQSPRFLLHCRYSVVWAPCDHSILEPASWVGSSNVYARVNERQSIVDVKLLC